MVWKTLIYESVHKTMKITRKYQQNIYLNFTYELQYLAVCTIVHKYIIIHKLIIVFKESQRNVVYLDWPIAPKWGGGRGLQCLTQYYNIAVHMKPK